MLLYVLLLLLLMMMMLMQTVQPAHRCIFITDSGQITRRPSVDRLRLTAENY